MKKRLNLFKNKTLASAIIILLIFSSAGLVSAYWKLVQNPLNPKENDSLEEPVGYGSDEERDFEIRKSFLNPYPPNSRLVNDTLVTAKDSSINYQIWFKGKIDQNPAMARADVILLIDRSMSMKSKVPRGELPSDCLFMPDRNFDNSKLCWSVEAANSFIGLAADPKNEIRVGYVTYGADKYTTDEESPQYFKSLAEMWVDPERNQTKNWLKQVNFHADDVSGTAMGKATEIALNELQENGRANVQKYIIVLTDGIGNLNPLMTGCASWRRNPSDAWPSGWPNSYLPCAVCPWGYRPDPNDPSKKVCQAPGDAFPGPYTSPPERADLVDCCITSDAIEAYQPFRAIRVTDFSQSPVGKTAARNILMPMIGFGTVANMNRGLMEKIVESTYKYPQAKNEWAFINQSPIKIQEAFRRIFYSISGDRAVPIHFEETLPAGVEVSDIKIERNVKNLDKCSDGSDYYCRIPYTTTINSGVNGGDDIVVVKTSDASGRVVLKFDLIESHYSGDSGGSIPFENRRFFVSLKVNTANASALAFDLDQNRDLGCGGSNPIAVNPVSYAKWTFKFPHDRERITPTPKLCVQLRPTQYTGDVYGTSINNYLFPGIDVLVSGSGITPLGGTLAVWELENYKFSGTSFSNFDHYQSHLQGQVNSLIQKAATTDLISALRSNTNLAVNPEGRIFYVPGSQTIGSNITMGRGRRTVIIEGDLTINASLVKNPDKGSTTAIIVLGNVLITGDSQKSVQAGIITPGFASAPGFPLRSGLIRLESSSNYLNVLGFLVGSRVNLKSQASSDTQSILYDADLANYPPPGLANLALPFFQEVAP